MKKTFILLLVLTAIVLIACKSTTEVVTSTEPTTTTSTGESPATTTSTDNTTTTQTTTTASTVNCVDSDNGLSSYDTGYVDDIDKVRHNDKCVGSELLEWYCTPEGLAKSKSLTCPEGCNSQGTACSKPASLIESEKQAANPSQSSTSGSGTTQMSAGNCTDTDNGLTYGTKGTCKDGNSYPSPFADFCSGQRDLIEMSCDTTTDSCVQNTYTCSGNCVNGACV